MQNMKKIKSSLFYKRQNFSVIFSNKTLFKQQIISLFKISYQLLKMFDFIKAVKKF